MTSILSESTNSEEEDEINPIINEAYALLCEDRIDEGIQMYKKCIESHPRCWRVYQNLGVAYIMCKDYENANKVLKTYVMHVPRDPFGHDSLGVSFSQLNDPLQAIASFVNSINLSPGYYMSYYNLGVVLAKLQLYEYALNVYQHCLTLYPNYINAMNNIADIYKKLDRIDEAMQIFHQIIEIDPQYVLGIRNLGNCYFAKKDYYSAILTYLKAISIEPTHDSALHNLALCLDHFGLFYEAGNCILKSYDSSIEKDAPSNIAKPFIAANLFNKQLKRLNSLLRLLVKFRKNIDHILETNLIETYLAAIECYTISAEVLPNCPEIYQNIQCTRLNLVSYQAKLNKLSELLKSFPQLQYCPEVQKVMYHLKKQKIIMRSVIKWRKYTKRLVQKIEIKQTFSEKKYSEEQEKIYQMFSNKLIYPIQSLRWKTSTYVSRTHHHNINRLILKRTKFVEKYKRFNRQFSRVFRYRVPLTTLTDSTDSNQEYMNLRNSNKNQISEEKFPE